MRPRWLPLVLVLALGPAGAQEAVLHRVPNARTLPSSPRDLTAFEGRLFFSATDGIHGRELWATDGTAAGTFLLADLNPGPSDSDPSELTVSGRRLFFTAHDGLRRQIFRSDGTPQGTGWVLDQLFGQEGPRQLTEVAGRVFLTARDRGLANPTLWVTDGTPQGTVAVSREASNPRQLTRAGDRLFFVAIKGLAEIWTSDGTGQGTVRLREVRHESGSPPPGN